MAAAPFHSVQFTKLVTTGATTAAAISPDGKLVARAVSGEGGQSLWTRQVATQAGLQILPPVKASFVGVTFSPDGEYVYYALKAGAERSTLYKIPALGGASTRVIDGVDGAVAFSPDGTRIAFVREDTSVGTSRLLVSDSDGSRERVLSERTFPRRWFTTPAAPTWSPDGTKVACGHGDFSAKDDPCVIVEVPVDGGEERRITAPHPDWWTVGQVAWLPDGGGLVASIEEAAPSGPRWQIFSIAYPGGQVRRITNDTHHYVSASLTKDGGTLLVVELGYRSAIWRFERADARRAKQLTFGETDGIVGLDCAPDGRLVFGDVANSLWVADADGSNPRLLTGDDHTNMRVSFAPDGASIIFASWRAGSFAVWRMDADGGNARQLTTGPDDDFPRCTPDGWVLFTSTTRSGSAALYKVPLAGGQVTRVSEEPVVRAIPSPDGRWIGCVVQRPDGAVSIGVMPSEGGALRELTDVAGIPAIRWRRDGKAVSYAAGAGQLWEVSLDGGPAKQIAALDSGSIFNFDWSPDGTRFVAARGDTETSLVLISALQ
jgi:Tol biopolymer transport system component